NWESEIRKFSPDLKCGIYYGNFRDKTIFNNVEVIITTYGTVRNDIEYLKEMKFDLIVLDESQNIKNVNAQTTKAVMLLDSKYRLALSGTPIENNLGELYSLFRFLNPSMFGTLDEFNYHYANPIQKENDKEAIEELKKKIYPFILRRVKKEVLKDLPDKIEKTLFIGMNPEQKRLYEERRAYYYGMINSQIKTQGLGKTQFYILQALNELRQLTSCPEMKNPNVLSSKREVLINNVQDAVENGHKVLIFTNYIKSIESITSDLRKRGIKYLEMTGATKDRQGLVNLFQKDKKYKVFVMTLKTGGVGLNLTAADTIFIYDPWWNKTVENQAVDRAYRLGQDRTVFSYKLILKDTIEEKILKLQESKSQLLDNLISDEGATLKTLT
ncbi:MAG: DEAD/DEAH box helicase, partial [Cetobacterium sp.]